MAFVLNRAGRARGPVITLVPMVDVMVIMLIFFMVTSTYLDLDMVPAVQQADRDAPAPAPGPAGAVLMVRIAPGGATVIAGETLAPEAFSALLKARLAADPQTRIVLLPSAEAALQDLISAMDRATQAGVTQIRVIRLEARP